MALPAFHSLHQTITDSVIAVVLLVDPEQTKNFKSLEKENGSPHISLISHLLHEKH